MKHKLTKTAVERLAPRDRAYEIYDTEIAGLTIRVQPGGQRSRYLRYRLPKLSADKLTGLNGLLRPAVIRSSNFSGAWRRLGARAVPVLAYFGAPERRL